MFSVKNIIRNNNSTFYDFNNRKRKSQRLRIFLTIFIAICSSVFLSNVSDNLLAGFLAVQSILLGFTFNVMFFLIGNRDPTDKIHKSIEDDLRSEKLQSLYKELFFNVSYFNMISVFSIISAIVLLLPQPVIPEFVNDIAYVDVVLTWFEDSNAVTKFHFVSKGLALFIFYALAIEVIFTIGRVIGRTSFYLERKIGQVGAEESADS